MFPDKIPHKNNSAPLSNTNEKKSESYYEFLDRTNIADTQENYEKFLMGYDESQMN